MPDPDEWRARVSLWEAHGAALDAALAERDAQVAAGFPDQENPTDKEEPTCAETGQRFSYISAAGVAKLAIGKIERRACSGKGGALEVEKLVIIAREAIEALSRICVAERKGTYSPVARLRELYDREPYPVLHYPNAESEAAIAQGKILDDLARGDWPEPGNSDNEIDELVRRIWWDGLGKGRPLDLTDCGWVSMFVGMLKRLPEDSPEATLRDRVLNVKSYADKNMRSRRIRTITKKRDAGVKKREEKILELKAESARRSEGNKALVAKTWSELEREIENIKAEARLKIEQIQKIPAKQSHHNEAWKALESRLGEWVKNRRAAVS